MKCCDIYQSAPIPLYTILEHPFPFLSPHDISKERIPNAQHYPWMINFSIVSIMLLNLLQFPSIPCESVMMAVHSIEFIYCLGLVVCLLWNIVAVTTAWIKGEGKLSPFICLLSFKICRLPWLVTNSHSSCRSNNMVSCYYLLHIRCTWSICWVVSSSLPCYKV